jgi:hypothetical protein
MQHTTCCSGYIRAHKLVDRGRVELPNLHCKCSSFPLAYRPKSGTPHRIRTYNPAFVALCDIQFHQRGKLFVSRIWWSHSESNRDSGLRRPVLCPVELWNRNLMTALWPLSYSPDSAAYTANSESLGLAGVEPATSVRFACEPRQGLKWGDLSVTIRRTWCHRPVLYH